MAIKVCIKCHLMFVGINLEYDILRASDQKYFPRNTLVILLACGIFDPKQKTENNTSKKST